VIRKESSSESVQSEAPLRVLPAHLMVRRFSSQPSMPSEQKLFEEPEKPATSIEKSASTSEIPGVKNDEVEEEDEFTYPVDVSTPFEFPPYLVEEFKNFLRTGPWPLLQGEFGEKLSQEVHDNLRINSRKTGVRSIFTKEKIGKYVGDMKNIDKALMEDNFEVLPHKHDDKVTCSFCQGEKPTHRLRIIIPAHLIHNPSDKLIWSDWRSLCRSCRERLSSVYNLYMHLQKLKADPVGDDFTVVECYREVLRLRLNMQAARLTA